MQILQNTGGKCIHSQGMGNICTQGTIHYVSLCVYICIYTYIYNTQCVYTQCSPRSKEVTWCFTPSPPVGLYQGEFPKETKSNVKKKKKKETGYLCTRSAIVYIQTLMSTEAISSLVKSSPTAHVKEFGRIYSPQGREGTCRLREEKTWKKRSLWGGGKCKNIIINSFCS